MTCGQFIEENNALINGRRSWDMMGMVMRTWVSGIGFVMQVVQQSSHEYLNITEVEIFSLIE
jgi:hypothetical protein